MTDKNEIVVIYQFATPSKGKAGKYFTRRFGYNVWNILVPPALEIAGVTSKVLRASATLRVFDEDFVKDEDGLKLFDEIAIGLELTTKELVHGIYNKDGAPLQIRVRNLPQEDFRNRMPLYVCDPARKNGRTAFSQQFFMDQLVRAQNGGDNNDRIPRGARPPVMGLRVGKKVMGTGVDSGAIDTRTSYTGYVLVVLPAEPEIDLEAKTATFNNVNDLGCAVYIPLSLITLMSNLYFKLEPRWRKLIEEDHELLETNRNPELADNRRLQLTAGRDSRKPNQGEQKRSRKRGADRKGKAQAESRPEETVKADDATSAEAPSPTTAEA
jgi:hypothetical protein